MDMLVGIVANTCKDSQIRFAAMVDKASGAREIFAVDLEWGATKAGVVALRVGELIQCKEVDVLVLGALGRGTAPVGLFCCDNLANVFVDKVTTRNRELTADA